MLGKENLKMASIEKRGKNSFRLIVELGYDSQGKRIKRSKTVKCKGITEARKELAKFQTEVEAGEYISPEKMTLSSFIKDWEMKYGRKELGENTLEEYKRTLNNHIIPELGHMRFDQVKPIQIVNFLSSIKRKDGKSKPLSIGTIQFIHRVLKNVFERAKEWQLIKENPVSSVKKPKDLRKITEVIDNNVNVYTEKEVEELFKAVQKEIFHWRIFVSLALAAGLRRGELLGLEWKNVDLDGGTIRIAQTIVRGKKGRPLIKGTKSRSSNRIISLPPSIIEELKKFQLHWRKEKMRMRDAWIEDEREWLFCNEDGTHFYPTTPTTWWRRFIEKVEVRYIRLHDLRHTSATLLINQGVHAKIISERLGHADIRITMDTYGHALTSADQEAANKLDSLFSTNVAGD